MTEALKKKIQKSYDTGSTKCPCCDSSDLVAGQVQAFVGDQNDKRPKAKCHTTCGACGFSWEQTLILEFGFSKE